MNLSDFHFLRPAWFLALVPLFLVVRVLLRRTLAARSWEAVCSPELIPHILSTPEATRSRILPWLAALGGMLAITALAGPTWERLPQPVFREQSALVIVLDLSASMDTQDITPSRLARARYKVSDILRERREGQTALVVYAGDAFAVTPLTQDTATIAAQLNSLETSIMPAQGSRVDLALQKAAQLLQQAGATKGAVLLVSDGVESAVGLAEAEALAAKGIRLSVLGTGTSEGGPIPALKGGFLKDASGSIVLSQLEEDNLRALARSGGGTYHTISSDDRDLQAVLRNSQPRRLDSELQESDLTTDTWREAGPWLLLPLLPLAALSFRRGWLVWVLIAMGPLATPAQALDFSSLWQRPDQKAARAFEAGNTARAAELFSDPEWKSAALYREGHFEHAAQALEGINTPDALYNKGNALAQLGLYDQALAAYEEVLKKDPDHADAKYNRDQIQKRMEQQASEQNPSQTPPDSPSETCDSPQKEENSDQQPSQEGEQGQDQQPNQGQPSPSAENNKDDTGSQQGAEQEMSEDPSEQQPENQAKSLEQQQADARKQLSASQEGNSDNSSDETALSPQETDSGTDPEQKRESEMWMRRIPDDPGGLLRRKFQYQYKKQPHNGETNPW